MMHKISDFFKLDPHFRAEIQKNIWQEFSKFRVIGFISLFLLVFFALFQIQDLAMRQDVVNKVVSIVFFASTFLMGFFWCTQIVANEKSQDCWNMIALSPMKPLNFVLASVLGRTSFAWMIGIVMIVVYITNNIGNLPARDLVKNINFVILASFMLHFCGFWISYQSANKKVNAFLPLFMISLIVVFGIAAFKHIYQGSLPSPIDTKMINFYHSPFDAYGFIMVSMGLVLLWMILWSVDALKNEFFHRKNPALLIGFILFLGFYGQGVLSKADNLIDIYISFIMGTCSIALAFVYIALLSNRSSFVDHKYFIKHTLTHNFAKAWTTCPTWIVCFVCFFVFTVLSLFIALFLPPENINQTLHSQNIHHQIIGRFLFAFLFVVRDIIIYVYFLISSRTPAIAARKSIFIYILCYMVVPILIISMGIPQNIYYVFPIMPFGTIARTFDLVLLKFMFIGVQICIGAIFLKRKVSKEKIVFS
jgi:hypothetical protein